MEGKVIMAQIIKYKNNQIILYWMIIKYVLMILHLKNNLIEINYYVKDINYSIFEI